MSFCVHWLARHNSEPQKRHYALAKQVLAYLIHSKEQGITVVPSKGEKKHSAVVQVLGYSDADYANDHKQSKSTTGWLVKLDDDVIDYGSKKQPYVARSTFEAEFMAVSTTVERMLFFDDVLKFLEVKQSRPPTLSCDNLATVVAYNAHEATRRSRTGQRRAVSCSHSR